MHMLSVTCNNYNEDDQTSCIFSHAKFNRENWLIFACRQLGATELRNPHIRSSSALGALSSVHRNSETRNSETRNSETRNSETLNSFGLNLVQHDGLVLYVVLLHGVREKLLYDLGKVFLV